MLAHRTQGREGGIVVRLCDTTIEPCRAANLHVPIGLAPPPEPEHWQVRGAWEVPRDPQQDRTGPSSCRTRT